MRPARRLPKSLRRTVSPETRRVVKRTSKGGSRTLHDRFRRVLRRTQRKTVAVRRSFVQWMALLFVGLLLLAVGLFLFSPLATVREIRVTRQDARLDIQAVQESLAPLFGRHVLLLSTSEVETMVEETIPDIESVVVERQLPSAVVVHVTLQPLKAKIAILDPESETGVSVGTGAIIDFLTEEGVYIRTPLVEETGDLPLLSLVDWGVRPSPGSVLLPPSFLERLNATERALHALFGYNVGERRVYVRAQEFHLAIGGGKSLWFDTRSPLEKQLQQYRTFLRHVSIDEVEQYVDLRLSDRVVYR